MKMGLSVAFCVLSLFTSLAVSQGGTSVSGVTFDSTVKVGNSELLLNGAGVRTKGLFKVYSAGIYLTTNKTTTADVLALQGAKRVKIVMLRDVDTNALASDFKTAFNNNTSSEERTRLFPVFSRFVALFNAVSVLKKGDILALDWIPGEGVSVNLNGRVVASALPEDAFYQALLRVWLGTRPADSVLKKTLLGG
jgi:Chalcone isomerase-like